MSRRRSDSGLDGILLVDKEPGWTSHDVVAKLRGITGQPRAGHTGTLDPAATGLLVVCFGRATRLVEYMTGHDKAYEGEITLGATTDTDDAEGQVLATAAVPVVTSSDLHRLCERFTGDIEQVPPAFSAIKVQGTRAYTAARKGAALVLEPRAVRIDALELELLSPNRLKVSVECGAGTYVRSLARDIGAALGCGGHLAWLRRTRVGGFVVEDSATIAEIEAVAKDNRLASILRAPDEGVMEHDAIVLGGDRARVLSNGERLRVVLQPWEASSEVRVYSIDGSFHGIADVRPDGTIAPVKMMPAAVEAPARPQRADDAVAG